MSEFIVALKFSEAEDWASRHGKTQWIFVGCLAAVRGCPSGAIVNMLPSSHWLSDIEEIRRHVYTRDALVRDITGGVKVGPDDLSGALAKIDEQRRDSITRTRAFVEGANVMHRALTGSDSEDCERLSAYLASKEEVS